MLCEAYHMAFFRLYKQSHVWNWPLLGVNVGPWVHCIDKLKSGKC